MKNRFLYSDNNLSPDFETPRLKRKPEFCDAYIKYKYQRKQQPTTILYNNSFGANFSSKDDNGYKKIRFLKIDYTS